MKKAIAFSVLSLSLLGSASAQQGLTVWTHFGDAEGAWLKAQTAAWSKANGNMPVTVVNVPFASLTDKFIQSAPKNQGPDLVVTQPQDRIGQMAAAGIIAPMDQYILSKADLQKVALDAMTYRGKLFGLPMFAEAVALVYNKKLVSTAPTTWDQFLKDAQQNTGNGKYGFLVDLANAYQNYGVISAYGGYIFKNSGGTLDVHDVGIGDAGAQKAMAFLNDLRYKYNLVPQGVTGDAAKAAFISGRLAMYLTGPWDMADVKKAGLNYGIANMPLPPGATNKWSPFVGVQGVVMSAYSKNKAAAASLAKALVSSTAQVSFNKAGGRIPVSKAALVQLKNDPVVLGFSKAIAVGTPMPNVPEMGSVWGPWTNAVTQSTAKANPDYSQILNSAVKEINNSIK